MLRVIVELRTALIADIFAATGARSSGLEIRSDGLLCKLGIILGF
jgi:hypothetical protein